ncbi:MAG: hypothetical protein ABI690_16750 [Chloroflexota bacterium]
MNASLLERIASIDWTSKGFPDVPTWLNNLLSNDENMVLSAYTQLDEYIIQGGVSDENFDLGYRIEEVLRTDAPDILAEFLIELLSETQPLGLSKILTLLIGQSTYINFRLHDDSLRQRAIVIYRKIWAARTIYVPFLMHVDRTVRRKTVLLLCQFRDNPNEVIPLVLEATTTENDSYTVMSNLQDFTIDFLRQVRIDVVYEHAYLTLLKNLLVSPLGFVVQVVAAYHIVEQLLDDAPKIALDRLVEGMIIEFDHEVVLGIMAARPEKQNRLLMKLHPKTAIDLALQVLKRTFLIQNALCALVTALSVACEPPALEIDGFFLQPVVVDDKVYYEYSVNRFTLPEKFDLSALTPRQTQVIQAVVETNLIWTVVTNLFDLFGLPSNRIELESLLHRE